MAKKKHLQGIEESDMEYIDEKMKGGDSSAFASPSNFVRYDFKVSIKCKNHKQKEFLNLLKNDEKQICVGLGAAGSGKSFISLAYALNTVKVGGGLGKYKHIVCLVPTCPAGNMNIGFLKGTLEEKIEPYLEADTHTMEKILEQSGNYSCRSTIEGLIRNGVIKYELVNFSRGKTFDDSLILINEAENYSKEEMLLIMTRIGENSKIVITGDLEQCDRKDIKQTNKMCGLEYACAKLEDLEEFGSVEFGIEDIVRNPIITKIITKWKE